MQQQIKATKKAKQSKTKSKAKALKFKHYKQRDAI